MICPDLPGPLFLFFLFLLAAPRAWSRPTGPLGLSEAIATAIRDNRDLAILEKEIERTGGAVAASSRLFRKSPELSGRVERRAAPGGSMIDYSLARWLDARAARGEVLSPGAALGGSGIGTSSGSSGISG